MSWELITQLTVNGLLLGGVYAILAMGLTLVFGVQRIINFAHGEFMILAGLTAYFASRAFPAYPLWYLLLTMPLLYLVGWVLQRFLISRVTDAPMMMSLLLTFGLSFTLMGLGLLVFGGYFRSIQTVSGSWSLGFLEFSKTRSLAFVMSVAVALLFGLFLQRTRLGKAIRATAQHAEMAMVCGIDVARIRRISFGIGAALAGAAGTLLVMIFAIDPQSGSLFVLKAFAVIILGGLGSYLGAFFGGLILGVGEVMGAFYISTTAGEAVAYVIMILVLLLMPSGLFGVKEKS